MKSEGLINYTVVEYESDLHISSSCRLEDEARKYLIKYRQDIISYALSVSSASNDISFYKSLIPMQVLESAPDIIKHMAQAAASVSVGPMACVAGAISQYVGYELLKYTDEIIIENGGDIFIKCNTDKKVLIFAGQSPFSNKVALSISAKNMPMGICTSAGTVGHSLSFGIADAVVVLSKDTLLADAAATAIGNIIISPGSVHIGIEYAKTISGILGVLIIIGDKMGVWGDITLVEP